ncbi:hypothetical protein AOC36_05390 [Erysipelothrix larvae]|uniref:SHS2 domain-containing protein n=1 Tax=Erysipelothrix larvae TaxID=1514105 RepID=A0A0X8GZS2_9FIRM|nr:hypothetical protein [Erysipelothrix larvae]AMC93432.1 hypothetical protein AOC36_05390 [Erysipelothrix larvae]
MEKRIIAALEIADREVRLLVGQFYNGRINILKVEHVDHDGYIDGRLVRGHRIVEAIEKAVQNASANLNAHISKVIVSVYGLDNEITSKRISLPVVGRISEYDLKRALKEVYTYPAPENMVCVNALFTRFYVNGVPTRKIPVNERNENVQVDYQAYYCNQDALFEIIRCVENAGLEVIDVVLSDIGFASEALLFEASVDHPVVGVTFEMMSTQLSLYYQGQLASTMHLNYGFEIFLKKLMETYKLSRDVVERLLFYDVDVSDVSPNDDPIFIWSTKSNSHHLSAKDLLNCIGNDIIKMLDDIHDTCEPIYQLGNVEYVFTGVASRVDGLVETMHAISDADARVYRSSTFGVKDPRYTSLIGSFYYYKDTEFYRGSSQSSIDEEIFVKDVIGTDKHHSHENENTVTKRLRTLFMD